MRGPAKKGVVLDAVRGLPHAGPHAAPGREAHGDVVAAGVEGEGTSRNLQEGEKVS